MFSNMYVYILFVQIIGELDLSVYNLLFTTEIFVLLLLLLLLNYLNETFL